MMYCYYPTTTIAIDDDADFLKTMTQHLGIADFIAFSSPNKALTYLKNQDSFHRIQSRISTSSNTDTALSIDLKKLYEEIYIKTRFSDVAVLIVDYHMDTMNGIEFCESLAHHPAKKILLTGGMDKEKIAIDAFNRGIIHRFVNKTDTQFAKQLIQAVTSLKEAYFRDLTACLLPLASPSNTHLLQNPVYLNLIKNIQEQFNAIEYYLLDSAGSSVFLDTDANPIWLVIKHEYELKNYIQIAQDQDIDREFIHSLNKFEKIPFFFLDDDYQSPVSDWEEYLYSAKPLAGVNGYHFSIIQGHIRNNLIQNNIIQYR